MGDLIVVLLVTGYMVACIYFWREKSFTKADITKLEQMLKDYKD